MTRYTEMFETLERNGEGAFVPFVVLGDPTPAASAEIIRALIAGGADALELGIPFSDPTADGPTIQAAGQRALAAGVTPADCWRLLTELREEAPHIPVGLLVYANLVVNRGMADFYSKAAAAGVDSVLVADVPSIEALPFAECASAHGVDPVLIAPLNATGERLELIAKLSQGYTYVTTRAGVTGAGHDLQLGHEELLSGLRAAGAPPPIFGFGISTPEHVAAAIASGAAGAISGSAVVGHIDAAHDVGVDLGPLTGALTDFVRSMKAATRSP
jgi:tryptophan synthase alpha chain